ncbi:hypothetical protein BGX31_002454, partial [Mortierella sp. GBA43]
MYHQSSQGSANNSLLTQPLSPDSRFQPDYPATYLYDPSQDKQQQQLQLQQLQLYQLQQQQQLQRQQLHHLQQQQHHQTQTPAFSQEQAVPSIVGQDSFVLDPSLPLYDPTMSLTDPGLLGNTANMTLPAELGDSAGNDWTSFLTMGSFGDNAGSLTMDQFPLQSEDSK